MFVLTAVLQVLICNYCNFSLYITLSILPVLILYLPLSIGPILSLVIAFVTGLAVDATAEGILGLNALALVPTALIRKPLLRIMFGEELMERKESPTFRKYGFFPIMFTVLIMEALFLVIYITADGAGTRPFWFNLARFAASLGCSTILAMITAGVIMPDYRK